MRGGAFLIILIALGFSFSTWKIKKFIPPGTVAVSEVFFADETEISNFSWREYEFWTAIKYGFRSKEHLQTLPDTLVWRDSTAYNEAFSKYHYRHPAYQHYPVVGISYDQAVAFCKWRTDRVKEFYYIVNKKDISIEYRLPTKEEWELVSNNGMAVFSNKGKTEKGLYKLNCARGSEDTVFGLYPSKTDYADVTAPVYSYWKNGFGLFNVFGNVSEMLVQKGLSKGGSWRH